MDASDLRTAIDDFLQRKPHTSLIVNNPYIDPNCNKAGVIPFIRPGPAAADWQFLCMKPASRHTHLAPPDFQICKGTRMRYVDGVWLDIKDGDPSGPDAEPFEVTALREGTEELGLRLECISEWFDTGLHVFSSAKSGKSKTMRLFALELSSADKLLPIKEIETTTAERLWLTLGQFEVAGRGDHYYIMRSIAGKLAEA